MGEEFPRSLRLLSETLPGLGIATTSTDSTDAAAVEAALRPETRLILIEVVSNLELPDDLVQYASAQVFSPSRAASSWEQRVERQAADLADGLAPDQVRDFRRAVLALRDKDGLRDAFNGYKFVVCDGTSGRRLSELRRNS